MSAEKRVQNWILIVVVLIIAIAAPVWKVTHGEPAINQGIDLVGGVDLLLEAQIPQGEERITQDMMAGAINIVRNRLDPEGVREIIIQQMGDNRIVIQIPGEDDPEQVKGMIGATAILRFIDAGSDPIPEGKKIRFIDAETGEVLGLPGIESEEPEEETWVPIEPEEELPSTVVMAEQILFKPEDMIGFSLEVEGTGDSGSDDAADDDTEEIADDSAGLKALVLTLDDTAALTLPSHAAQNMGNYLLLTINNMVQSQHEITGGLTNRITFPGLVEQPGFDLDLLNDNLDLMKVVAFSGEPPAIGTPLDIWDPMGGQVETETVVTGDGIQRLDITTDRIILTGDDFADAEVRFGQVGNATIGFEFKAEGRNTFGRYTALALDDEIISCPRIREPILHGSGVIEGQFTHQQAKELVIQLDSGRLPVQLEIIENRTVGPTLGAKSINDSKRAGILGGILILLFMAFYYRLPGFLADIALIFYVTVFFGALAVLNATLTLPGIAGFILSVGMAVDANVIIFERLKEELKTGKTFRSATDAAFKRAFLAIFDANVTTLITALVLYNLGTGPIRGFAVTLSMGIIVSMFSALVFTRLLIETCMGSKALQKYSLFGIKEKDVAVTGRGGDRS